MGINSSKNKNSGNKDFKRNFNKYISSLLKTDINSERLCIVIPDSISAINLISEENFISRVYNDNYYYNYDLQLNLIVIKLGDIESFKELYPIYDDSIIVLMTPKRSFYG